MFHINKNTRQIIEIWTEDSVSDSGQVVNKINHSIVSFDCIAQPFDKEMLINKIKAGLKVKTDKEEGFKNAEIEKEKRITELFEKYKNVPGFSAIKVENGILTITIESAGLITVSAVGRATGYNITLEDIESEADFARMEQTVKEVKERIVLAQEAISALGNTGVDESTPSASAWLYEGNISIS